jgi:sialate O-acetylesterase
MPFYFVQLAPYRYNRGDALPEIWEAQRAALEIPNTGMAATTDIGNYEDIHPRNKQDVGKRLALWALAKTYGQTDLEYSGPLFRAAGIDGNRVIVVFQNAAGLKTRDGAAPTELTIAGDDGKFVEAEAKIDGGKLICWSDAVPNPTQVRLGWSENANPNLVNAAGLPALPFHWRK